jgi:hypothetical protein
MVNAQGRRLDQVKMIVSYIHALSLNNIAADEHCCSACAWAAAGKRQLK